MQRVVPRVAIVVPCSNALDRVQRTAFESYAATNPSLQLLQVDAGAAVAREAVRQRLLAAIDDGVELVGCWGADAAKALESMPQCVSILTQSSQLDIAFVSSVGLLVRVAPGMRALFEQPFAADCTFEAEIVARYLARGGDAQRVHELSLAQARSSVDSKATRFTFNGAAAENLRPLVLALIRAFSRYVGVGGLGTLIHYALLISCVEWFGLRAQTGAALGATAGAIVNYLLNYKFTFASQELHRRAVPKFASVALLGVLASGYGARAAGDLGIHYIPAQIACTLVVLVAGFFINRIWTFAPAPARRAADGATDDLQDTAKNAPDPVIPN